MDQLRRRHGKSSWERTEYGDSTEHSKQEQVEDSKLSEDHMEEGTQFCVYVSGISHLGNNATARIKKLFPQVTKILVKHDENTKKPKFAFVEFNDRSKAKKAVRMNGIRLNDQAIHVSFAHNSHKKQQKNALMIDQDPPNEISEEEQERMSDLEQSPQQQASESPLLPEPAGPSGTPHVNCEHARENQILRKLVDDMKEQSKQESEEIKALKARCLGWGAYCVDQQAAHSQQEKEMSQKMVQEIGDLKKQLGKEIQENEILQKLVDRLKEKCRQESERAKIAQEKLEKSTEENGTLRAKCVEWEVRCGKLQASAEQEKKKSNEENKTLRFHCDRLKANVEQEQKNSQLTTQALRKQLDKVMEAQEQVLKLQERLKESESKWQQSVEKEKTEKEEMRHLWYESKEREKVLAEKMEKLESQLKLMQGNTSEIRKLGHDELDALLLQMNATCVKIQEARKELDMCVVCTERRKVVLFDCFHLCLCEPCSKLTDKCPMCRAETKSKKKMFS